MPAETQPTFVSELLDIGRDQIVQRLFDAEVVLELLSSLSTTDLDTQTLGAVTHARLVATTALSERSQDAVARFALARVVTLLEGHVAVAVPRDHRMQDARTTRQPL